MATPMTADQMLAALKAEGVRVVEHAGWRTHNREGHGGWGPMNGVMIHHTAGSAPGDESVVWSGRSDLPGPLAHAYGAKDGSVVLVGNGRANHAGGGSPAVLAAVVAEKSPLPATYYHEGSSGAVDGNAHFYGVEISNLGTAKDAYPAVQYEAAVRWAAAICRFHGWTAKSVIGHKEWSDWKDDPSFSMTQFRADVAACLAAKPGVWHAAKEDDMALSQSDIEKVAKATADLMVSPAYRDQMTVAQLYWWKRVLDPSLPLPKSTAPVVGATATLRETVRDLLARAKG